MGTHEDVNLFQKAFGITLKDLDEKFEQKSYFLSTTGPTHLDNLLFRCLKLHTREGTGILPNSLLHWKRWGNHLHSYKISSSDSEAPAALALPGRDQMNMAGAAAMFG